MFCMLVAGCASVGETLDPKTAEDAKASVERSLTHHFTAKLRNHLMPVGVTFRKEVRVFIIGQVGGYYNPFTRNIVEDSDSVGCILDVHEHLHDVWFSYLTRGQRNDFRKDFATVLADPNEKVFGDYMRKKIAENHFLNDFFARSTESFSDIGELLLTWTPAVQVPEIMRKHYEGILILPGNEPAGTLVCPHMLPPVAPSTGKKPQ